MWRGLALVVLFLPLSGCEVPPGGPYDYGAPEYPQPAYPLGTIPDDYGEPVYPGFSYNDGAPVIIEGGMSMPLILLGGEWGYYDRVRHWHRAPDQCRTACAAAKGTGFG